ncbi:tape measure protein [Phyllobacterium zundukense]|uniref:Tape measure protein n=1 Tax=Phyllobacterium zundukense TaxID=1867719 RepID=A0ACD4D4Q5_9HYPH|nr:tape measure protein [Phyllobacterium zundukense]UXN60907.1 tape measure protein [Phyllobacterium zundukense]
MADDAASLVVQIRADQARFQREMSKVARDASRAADRVEKGFKAANSNAAKSFGQVGTSAQRGFGTASRAAQSYSQKLDQIAKKQAAFGSGVGSFIKGGVAGIAAGVSVGALKDLLDTNTRITNALKQAGLAGTALDNVYGQLATAAKATGSNFESLASLYGRVSIASKELGISQSDVLEFTKRMAFGLKASGTDAQQASDGIRQLTQSMASGVLRGDEFNSVMENLPDVARSIASGMGVTVGELRGMAEEGQLTAKKVFEAYMKGSADVEERAKLTSTTISGAFQNIGTALVEAAGEFDTATGASKRFAEFTSGTLIPAIEKTGVALADAENRFAQFWSEFQKQGAEAGKAMGTDWVGRAIGLSSISDAEWALRDVRKAAKDTGTEIATMSERLRRAGQGEMAAALVAGFGNLGTKIEDGTAKVADFDQAMERLQATGTGAGQLLAKSVGALREQYVAAGGDSDELKRKAEALGTTIADIFGKQAPGFIQSFIDQIGIDAPDAVQKLIDKLKLGAQAAAQLDTNAANVLSQLKEFGPALDPLSSGENQLGAGFGAASIGAGGIIGKGDFTAAKAFLKTRAVSSAAGAEAVEKLDNELAEKVALLLKQFPDIVVNEAFRTAEQQRALYAKLKPKGARVAAPGTSRHERGAAVDLSVGKLSPERYAELKRKAQELGLDAPFGDDRGHFQMAGGRDSGAGSEHRVAAAKAEKKAFDELYASNSKRLEQQRQENQINADATLSIDQKTLAIEKQRIATDLLDAAREQGLVVNDQLKAKIDAQAEAMARAGLAAEKLKTSGDALAEGQERQKQAAADLADAYGQIAKTAFSGFVNDLRNGVEAGEAFTNMLDRVIDGLINMAIEALFSKNALGSLFTGTGSGTGGGFLGKILGFGMHAGGTVGRDATFVRAVSANAFVGAKRYQRGGVAGFAPGEVPAILHKGEVVLPKGAVAKGGSGTVYDNRQNNVAIRVDSNGNAVLTKDQGVGLGKRLNLVVQEEIARQQRSGGLLAGTGPGQR